MAKKRIRAKRENGVDEGESNEEKRRKLEERKEQTPEMEEQNDHKMMEMVEEKKFDPLEWQISKRLPPRFRMTKNDVYITRRTQLAAQFNKCKTMLDRKVDQLVIHALGRAINRALKLALKLEVAMLHSIKLDVQTGSVTVTDDLTSLLDGNESMSRERQISSIYILLTRIEE